MKVTFRPLQWVGPSTPADARRSRYQFKAGWTSTLEILDRELCHLGAEAVILEADFTESDIRLDGMPRANARNPIHPGIRIAFDSAHGPLIYATDAYEWWQHNVRAIALGLEALRAVDRYGITHRGEQYTGWKAITAAPTMTRAQALLALAELAGIDTGPPAAADDIDAARRKALRRCHPDAGGTRADWDRLTDVLRVLGVRVLGGAV